MTIDIKDTVIKTQLRRFLTLIGFCLVVLALILFGGVRNNIMGMDMYSWALIIGLLYVISLVVESMLELNYIYFSDDGGILILRYFSMSMLNRKKNSIEIPKKEYGGYEIHTYLWGIKKKLVLLHRFKGKDARYPQVSLTGLNKKDLDRLIFTLDKWKHK